MMIVKFRQGNEIIQTELTMEQLEFLEFLIDHDCIDVDGLEFESEDR